MLALSPAYRPLRGNFMRALFIQTRTLNVSARRLRRILIAFIVATLASSAIVPSAHAVSGLSDGIYNCLTGLASAVTPTFTITSGVVSAGTHCAGAVLIPSGVTSIGIGAFYGATSLTSINIPAGVTSIGDSAFYEATSLTSINIPASVTLINKSAFRYTTSLTSITFSSGSQLTTISKNAFADSSLASVTSLIIPSSVTTIGLFAFLSTTSPLNSFTYCGSANLTSTGLDTTTNLCSTVPDAPTIGTATATGATTATVAFTSPLVNGGSTILTYTATSTPGSITATLTQAGSGTISVTGLSPTTSYTFTVIAHNAIGNSVASSASNSITTSSSTTVPGAPTIGTATSTGTTTATLSFTAPGSNGGSTILTYVATSSPGSISVTLTQAGSGTISFTGLSATTSYTFTIIAHNAVGNSLASSASNSITTGTPVLSAPLTVTVTGLNAAQIQVAFTAPASNGGSVVTSYTITSVPAKVTATLYQAGAGSVIFSGLEGGTNYTFSVIAHTALADSPETISTSGVIMPAYIPIPQMLPTAAPQLSSNGESLRCSAGGYSQLPSGSIFSLFVGGIYVSTNFSAGGAFLPDWIIDWATPGTISRTATFQDAIWKINPSWAGKKVSCRTVGYANNAIGITDSKALRL